MGTHVSEDPTRKRLVLSEEAETVPTESERSVARENINKELRLNLVRPYTNVEANTSCVSKKEWPTKMFLASTTLCIF